MKPLFNISWWNI